MACATLAAAEKGNETVGTYLMTELRLPSMHTEINTPLHSNTNRNIHVWFLLFEEWRCVVHTEPVSFTHTLTHVHTATADQSYSRWYKQQSG